MRVALPHLEQYNTDGTLWILKEDFLAYDPNGIPHTISAGLLTDLASVPWLLSWFLGRAEVTFASTPHDQWCRNLKTYGGRAWADAFFLYILEDYGVPLWKRWGAFVLLRIYAMLGLWKRDIGEYRVKKTITKTEELK